MKNMDKKKNDQYDPQTPLHIPKASDSYEATTTYTKLAIFLILNKHVCMIMTMSYNDHTR